MPGLPAPWRASSLQHCPTGAMTVNLIGLGDELGFYKALKANGGPMTPMELAKATGTHERWTQEWTYQQVRPAVRQLKCER